MGRLFSGLVIGETQSIKSIQTGTVKIESDSQNGVEAINAVDLDNSVVILCGCTTSCSANADWRNVPARIELDTTIQVKATRYTPTEVTVTTLAFVVIEFYAHAVTRIQEGTITIANPDTSNTDTVVSSEEAKSVCFFSGMTVTGGGPDDSFCHVQQSSPTVVTATRYANDGTVICGYTLVTLK